MDMLLDIDPYVYVPYITTDSKGIKQLITQCMNIIYRTMVSRLLYYCNFLKTLKLNKFKMNPCDPYVDNQLVNGLQQSILFHVDGCKLSHKDPRVNYIFIGILREEYQIIFEYGSGTTEMNRGKVHKYLGITLDYFTVGQLKIAMLDYFDEILDTFDESDP